MHFTKKMTMCKLAESGDHGLEYGGSKVSATRINQRIPEGWSEGSFPCFSADQTSDHR